jgi:23S rRNA (pseudouridine1915-N3)-methyltransferase
MRWHIIAIGKPKLDFARAGVDEYLGRLKPFAPTETHFIRAGSKERDGEQLLERSKTMFRVVLDERGEHIDSRHLANKLCEWELHGKRDLALIVAGSDGHTEEVRRAAGWLWSLSKLTLQHELAMLVALEQLYRAYAIKAGHPYHRD